MTAFPLRHDRHVTKHSLADGSELDGVHILASMLARNLRRICDIRLSLPQCECNGHP